MTSPLAPNTGTERRRGTDVQRARTVTSWLSSACLGVVVARAGVTGQIVRPVVVVSVQGLGGDFAEEPVFRCEPATQATEPFLECPAQAR